MNLNLENEFFKKVLKVVLTVAILNGKLDNVGLNETK